MRGSVKAFKNWQVKIVSLLIAIAVYFIASYAIQQKREITIPLNVILPTEYHATSIIPDSVNVIIMGTEDQIYMVDTSSLKASADFSRVDREGVSSVPVVVDKSVYKDILSLDNITIYTEPASVRIYFEK